MVFGDAELPRHELVYQRIRWLVLSGAWPRGMRLPPSRVLAAQMAVSRNTILNAMDRINSDGWVRGHRGSGVYVTYSGPRVAPAPKPEQTVSLRPPLMPCARAIDLFPAPLWNRLQSRRRKQLSGAALEQGDPQGWLPLREAIAAHVTLSKGIACGPEEIIVTANTQAVIDLAIRALDLAGAEAWVEDPGYPAALPYFRNCGLQLRPVPVDESGLQVACGIATAPRARLAIVTPACQFPTCAVMTKERRLALLAWASAQDAWIVENDFDWQTTDWRQAAKPMAATNRSRTIYVDSFNPILFPALGISFAICPPSLLDRFVEILVEMDDYPSLPNQMILADFLIGGHLDDHLRRVASAYPERRAAMIRCLEKELPGIVTPQRKHSGTHLVASLHRHREQQFADLCMEEGIIASGMSKFQLAPRENREMVFGHAGFTPAMIAAAVTAIRRAVGAG
ncbi:MAG TPA: PLP-dependent aminotransferase family protein [Rhizomicrobium sp.]|jgi:GntR family transcriptional regulator/MocR family aminotransferase|nr:PLP-dependent aminotransferase family protein [Rhizomicrobium sp.]